jgi:hypothetical protein
MRSRQPSLSRQRIQNAQLIIDGKFGSEGKIARLTIDVPRERQKREDLAWTMAEFRRRVGHDEKHFFSGEVIGLSHFLAENDITCRQSFLSPSDEAGAYKPIDGNFDHSFDILAYKLPRRRRRIADRTLDRYAALVPRRHREAWTRDLWDDVEEFRTAGWTERQLVRHIRWQFAFVLIERFATLLKLSEWASVIKAIIGSP